MKLPTNLLVYCIFMIFLFWDHRPAFADPPDLGFRVIQPNAVHVYDSLSHNLVPMMICDYDATALKVVPGLYVTGHTWVKVGNTYENGSKKAIGTARAFTWKDSCWTPCMIVNSAGESISTCQCIGDYRVLRGIISFNTASTALPRLRQSTGGQIDLAILEHEMGHVIGFGHDTAGSNTSIMKPQTDGLSVPYRLTTTDVAMIDSMY